MVVHGEVVGLKNGELVMRGLLEGDYKDRMADRLLLGGAYSVPQTHSWWGAEHHVTDLTLLGPFSFALRHFGHCHGMDPHSVVYIC